jgi:hypothetical protein
MLKYKDALQAMQAADQMMAASQPQPMPPTVAERTKLAAEQGIAGLASKLGAGIQQQGSNMQAQQMQQAMSGGLPQLPAPNMAGMAEGGIVGFDNGGGVEGEEDEIVISDEMRRAYAGYGFTDEQIKEALRRSAPADRLLEPVVEYAAENPVEAGLTTLAGGPLVGGALRIGAGALSKYGLPALSRLFTKVGPGVPRGPVTRGPGGRFVAGTPATGGVRVASVPKIAAGALGAKLGYDYLTAEGEEPPVAAEQASAQTPTAAPAVTPAAVEIPSTPQPAPEDMGPNATPAQFLLANAGTSRDAVQAVLEEEQQPRAGESASDRDARMRRLIAGLRGFGAQGLGGFAAGASEEELRQEQEGIAEQERQRRAGIETRGLDLEEQALAQRNEILQAEAKDRRFNQIMNLVANFSQLDDNMQNRMGTAIVSATENIANELNMVNRALADPSTSRGDRKRFEALRASLEQDMNTTVGRVAASFGESMDYRPIVESLLRSAMPAGMGATATTISPATLADLEQYGTP